MYRKSSSSQPLTTLMPSLEEEYRELWGGKWQWSQEQKEVITDILKKGFYVIDHIRKGTILFVGLNPSVLKKSQNNRIEDIADIQYFKTFTDISNKCGFDGDFSVADLFAIRCTTQDTLKKLLAKDRHFKQFCEKQFKLFLKIMHQAEPCVIVVCNAYASDWMKKNLEIGTSHFEDSIGTYQISTEYLKNVPIFFSGMLSGRHALDVYSRERLVWQIKRCLKKV